MTKNIQGPENTLAMDYSAITHSLDETQDPQQLFDAIVNVPFTDKLKATELGLGIVVLLLVNRDNGTLDRIALSNTEMASGAVAMSAKPFHEIKIPLSAQENALIRAITELQPHYTEDWAPMFVPELTPDEARFNQAGAGIACSAMYPLLTFDGSEALGALIFSYYEPLSTISDTHRAFMRIYTETVAAALVHAGLAVVEGLPDASKA
jgi:hypothetical protein